LTLRELLGKILCFILGFGGNLVDLVVIYK